MFDCIDTFIKRHPTIKKLVINGVLISISVMVNYFGHFKAFRPPSQNCLYNEEDYINVEGYNPVEWQIVKNGNLVELKRKN